MEEFPFYCMTRMLLSFLSIVGFKGLISELWFEPKCPFFLCLIVIRDIAIFIIKLKDTSQSWFKSQFIYIPHFAVSTTPFQTAGIFPKNREW